MPFGGLLSLGTSLVSGGSALAGLFGGSSNSASNVQTPSQYTYQNTSGADTNAYNGVGNLSQYNVAGQNLGQYQNLTNNIINNPYTTQYNQNSLATGQQEMQSGQQLTSSALNQLPSVSALMSLGFDPQNALYSKLQNQNQQQNAAILGQSGVASTPYGGGVATDANSNFNIDWQNQQLSRATQAASSAGSLLSSIGSNTNTGLNQMTQGAALPYNTLNTINSNGLNALNQAGSYGQTAQSSAQQQISDYLTYLSQATAQQGTNNQTAQTGLNQSNLSFNQNQTLGNQLGQSLAGLSKGWGNLNNSSSSNWPSSWSASGTGGIGSA